MPWALAKAAQLSVHEAATLRATVWYLEEPLVNLDFIGVLEFSVRVANGIGHRADLF